MIIKPYRYLFYRLYDWSFHRWGKTDGPVTKSAIIISVFIFFNFFALVEIIEVFTGYKLIDSILFYKPFLFFLALIYELFICFIFLRKNNYKNIIKEFEKEDSHSRAKGTFFVWCYIIGSIVFLLVFLFLAAKSMNANFTVFNYLRGKFFN